MTKQNSTNNYNKNQLMLCILIAIIMIIAVLILIPKNNKEKADSGYEAQFVTAETRSALTEEEQETITTYDDFEVVNHVIIDNLKAFDIYEPPINLTGNLANYLWLWLKYYTGDAERQWHVSIIGTSYVKTEELITFEITIDEFPNETITCMYYPHYAYYDFYNETILSLSDKNISQE